LKKEHPVVLSQQQIFQSTEDGSSKMTRSPVNKKGVHPQQDSSFRFSTGNITFDEREESLISASQMRSRADAKMLDDIMSEGGSNDESTHRHRSPLTKNQIEA
jgi:hypothetical protein